MDSFNKSEGNVDPFSNSPTVKIPNFFPKESNHYTPVNYSNSPNLKGAPSPIYEYFDASQKFLMNNEKICHKNMQSLFAGKNMEESPPNNEISINQQTPNYDNNFFNVGSLSPVNNQNNIVNKEVNEYLKSKKHLLTQNYNKDINTNDNIEINNNFKEIQNRNDVEEYNENIISQDKEQKHFSYKNINSNLTNTVFNNYNNIIQNNNNTDIKYNQIIKNQNLYQQQNSNSQIPQQHYSQIDKLFDNLQINPMNNDYIEQLPQNSSLYLNKNNNPYIENVNNKNIYFQQQSFPNTQNTQIITNNNNQQDMLNQQHIQINNNINQNNYMNVENIQNISISNLNPECYIFERFGKKGWLCEKCKNFNFECKLNFSIFINYIVRVICNKCKHNMVPKIINKDALFTEPKEKRKKPLIERKGDWLCPKCKNLNFTFRLSCNRCNLSKNEAEFINLQWNINKSQNNNVNNNNNYMNYSQPMNYMGGMKEGQNVNYGNMITNSSFNNYFN